MDDAGTYKCIKSNKSQEKVSKFSLSVNNEIKIFSP